MYFRDVIIAVGRLHRTLREAAGMPTVTVSVDYPGGGIQEKLDESQPPSDIIVVMRDGHGEHEVAHASWSGAAVSGKADPDGVIAMVTGDGNIRWDDVVRKLGHAPPGGQMALPFPKGDDVSGWGHRQDGLPRDNVADRMLAVPDAGGPDFARAMKGWVQGVVRVVGGFEALGMDDWSVCKDCGILIDESETTHAWSETYCPGHAPAFCDGCGEPIDHNYSHYDESTGDTYCYNCATDNMEDIWDEFYREHPKLRETDAIQMAADGEEMEPETYITLFRSLHWRDAYGGKAWGHIAETWRDMEKGLVAANGGGGDWTRLNMLIDHTFDLVHNSGSLFTKAKESVRVWLFQALEAKYFLDPLDYRDKLSGDVRKLLDLHIRYHGGVQAWKEGLEDKAKVMARFEDKLLRERDDEMARRLWDVHKLNAGMFHDRESFLDVAFWSAARSPGGYGADGAKLLREFLNNPTRRALVDIMENMDPAPFRVGTSHPAGALLRREFVPLALKLVESDAPLRAEMAKGFDDEADLDVVGESFYQPYWWNKWSEFFKGEQRRRKDESQESALAVALLSAFIKTALKQTDFYDFYALTLIECGSFPEDMAKMCAGLKKVMSITVGEALVKILKRAVIREARHVSDALSG